MAALGFAVVDLVGGVEGAAYDAAHEGASLGPTAGRRSARLEQHPTDSPGSIYVMPPEGPGEQAGWSPTTGDALATWLSAWIAEPSRADNLSKLGNADADEQQLFFELPAFHAAPFEVNDLLNTPNAPLPIAAPTPPPAVTHLWVMSTWTNWGDGFRWAPDSGWKQFAKVALADDRDWSPALSPHRGASDLIQPAPRRPEAIAPTADESVESQGSRTVAENWIGLRW